MSDRAVISMSVLFPAIQERMWCPDAAPSLTKRLLHIDPYRQDTAGSLFPSYRCYAAYLDGKQPVVIHGCMFSASAPVASRPVTTFRDFFRDRSPSSLLEVLCTIDRFKVGFDPKRCMLKDGPFDFPERPSLDAILHPSQGLLIWHHQTENLYRMAAPRATADQAVAFRKGINKKDADAFGQAERLMTTPACTLADVIRERMVYQNTTSPSWHAARQVYQRVVLPVLN